MTSLIVDASVAVKWFFEEPGGKDALELRDDDVEFASPDLVIAEIGHAAWKKWRRKEISAEVAMFAVRRAPLLFSSLVSILDLTGEASALSINLAHPIYDCFYLALAQRENAPLATADEAMLAAARKARITVRRI
jgi:predicted nucleic acid-binding protein